MSDVTINLVREKLHGLIGLHVADSDLLRLLGEVLGAGGSVTIELDDLRLKLVRRDGRLTLKKDEVRIRPSTLPPRGNQPR